MTAWVRSTPEAAEGGVHELPSGLAAIAQLLFHKEVVPAAQVEHSDAMQQGAQYTQLSLGLLLLVVWIMICIHPFCGKQETPLWEDQKQSCKASSCMHMQNKECISEDTALLAC